MALDVTDKTVFWGAVSANYYWGKRSGMVYTDWSGKSNAFKTKKWGNGAMNSGTAKKNKEYRSARVKGK